MSSMRSATTIAAFFLLSIAALPAATLEKLTLDEMIQKSTAIVRGRVLGARTAFRGPVIYTFQRLQVTERLKGTADGVVEVAVPGGTLGALRQTFSGAPTLSEGAEYVLFLWTGQNGVTQVIGLSQGVFDLTRNAQGEVVLARPVADAVMLDPRTGAQVQDQPVRMRLSELSQRISRLNGGGSGR